MYLTDATEKKEKVSSWHLQVGGSMTDSEARALLQQADMVGSQEHDFTQPS